MQGTNRENVKSVWAHNEAIALAKSDTLLQEGEPEAKLAPTTADRSLLDNDCYYFSNKYHNSFMGKQIVIYEERGDLYLTNTSLAFVSRKNLYLKFHLRIL